MTYPHVIKRKQQDLTLNTFDTQLCSLCLHLLGLLKRTKRLTLECPTACHQIVKAVAASKGVTVQQLVYHVIRKYLTELATYDEQVQGIRTMLLRAAELADCPPDICTNDEKELVVKATTHILPWD